MSYSEAVAADRRLLILRCLEAASGYCAGAPLIGEFLRSLGQDISSDGLAIELEWLAEQGLIERTESAALVVVRLRSRGVDAALGRTRIPGVRRPIPGEL
jgi:DNA-binding HxlR family transcriptional regulator